MDYSMQSKYNEKDNSWLISVVGEIDIFNSQDFKTTLFKLIDEKEVNIRIDCENLKYIDSTGLAALIAVLKRTKEYNGEITLLKPKANLEKLFKITNLDKVFIIEGDENEQ